MAAPQSIILLLTCTSRKEADAIAALLLRERLIACAKKIAVDSQFRWRGKIAKAKETLLLMESRAEAFARIEAAVKKMHAHRTFVLEALPIVRASAGVKKWIIESVPK